MAKITRHSFDRARRRWISMRDWATLLRSLPELNGNNPEATSGIRMVRNIPYGKHRRQRFDVFAPEGLNESVPVVVFIHGGGWRQGSKEVHRYIGRSLAKDGFVAVLPSYRLVPEHTHPAQIRDISAALAMVAREIGVLGGDPKRVIITGQSAGGHLAALAVCDQRWLHGFQDAGGVVRGWAPISGVYHFGPWPEASAKSLTRDLVVDRSLWDEAQPINHVSGQEPPCLLLHGREDWLVSPKQATMFYRVLKDKGVDVQLVMLPATHHIDIIANYTRPNNPTRAALVSFVNRCCQKGSPTPKG